MNIFSLQHNIVCVCVIGTVECAIIRVRYWLAWLVYLPLGVPQSPVLYEATSSGGEVSVEVGTAESGTLEDDYFQFDIRAVHTVTLEERNFTFALREYRDGERVAFVLTGFVRLEEGVESVYNLTARCRNRFGMSVESNQISVIILFNAGIFNKWINFVMYVSMYN